MTSCTSVSTSVSVIVPISVVDQMAHPPVGVVQKPRTCGGIFSKPYNKDYQLECGKLAKLKNDSGLVATVSLRFGKFFLSMTVKKCLCHKVKVRAYAFAADTSVSVLSYESVKLLRLAEPRVKVFYNVPATTWSFRMTGQFSAGTMALQTFSPSFTRRRARELQNGNRAFSGLTARKTQNNSRRSGQFEIEFQSGNLVYLQWFSFTEQTEHIMLT